jgi:hypothetical protein
VLRQPGRLRVLVVGNIHGGEVAGKEAALMLLRDLASGRHAEWADSLVLMVAPIFNADGNERIDPANRPLQHGPVDGMGVRGNAQGLDLNRDFEKLDTPEARALVAMMNAYDPHVLIDLHTTNGTVHAYHLTYAPPLHPITAEPVDRLLRDRLLPAVREDMRQRGYETFLYGNDKPEWGLPQGWATFDPRPRFLTNYFGLRDRLAILSEAYSYASFQDRVLATMAFLEAILDYGHANASAMLEAVGAAASADVVGRPLATRAAGNWQAADEPGTVLLGEAEVEENPHTGEPMWLRTDASREVEMTMYQTFEGMHVETVPAAYLVPIGLAEVLDRLAAHGILHYRNSVSGTLPIEWFVVDEVRQAERPFQGRSEVTLTGSYEPASITLPREQYLVVPMDQPLRRLAFLLLEPTSDAGFASWGMIPAGDRTVYPVLRVMDTVSIPPP